mgnify:FL=1
MSMSAKRKKKGPLRAGFTTGTAAAAAARAAAAVLAGLPVPRAVDIRLLTGETWSIPIENCQKRGNQAECRVIKDAGDDPDVTHQAVIGACVKWLDKGSEVEIAGGEGVGQVTKPGLEVPPGEAAINPGPRRMIREAVADAMAEAGQSRGVHVTVFVPRGRELARRTLNRRLGIEGGISILGTTGVVRPMSHEAYAAAIRSAFAVAAACGTKTVVCTTGRRSERHAQALFPGLAPEAFVQIGDYFAESMQQAAKHGFDRAVLAVFFGKAVKMAQGAPHTHAAKSRLALEALATWARAEGAGETLAERITGANTAREAFFMIEAQLPALLARVVQMMKARAEAFAGGRLRVRALLFDYSEQVAADTDRKTETEKEADS